MFDASDNGGHTAAVLTSFIATCKHLRIDPFACLRDVLERINANPHDRLDELHPDKRVAARAAVAP